MSDTEKPATVTIETAETFKRLQRIQDSLREEMVFLSEHAEKIAPTTLHGSEYAWSFYGVLAELRRSRLMIEGFLAQGPWLFTEAARADHAKFNNIDIALAGGDPDVDPVNGKTEE